MKLIRAIFWGLFWISAAAALVCLMATIAAGNHGFVMELCSHFHLIYLVAGMWFLVLVLVGLFLFQLPRLASVPFLILAALLISSNISAISQFYQSKAIVQDSVLLGKLKILHINVLGVNRDYQAVEALIRNEKPDILTLAEYNPRWQKQLEQSGVLKRFQSAYVVKYGNDGIYSTIPFDNVKLDYVKPGQDSTAQVHFKISNVPVTFLVVHPRPPVKPKWYKRNRNHFAYWEKHWPEYGPNVLLVGDLNNSPWSYTFRHFMAATGMQDSQTGIGVQPSWPVAVPDRGIQHLISFIPIDHVLYSKRFAVLSRKTGPQVGSDHLPVIAEIGLLKH